MKKISKFSGLACLGALLFSSFALTGCKQEKKAEVDPIDDNYRTFYEIFTTSFADSDDDGIGDLNGINKKFDYLNDGNINGGSDLGIQGIWLTPIFDSPSYHKYDVRDYYKIDPTFGTDEDFENLLNKAHSRNVKIIIDLVINHTSVQHPWFKAFVKAHQEKDVNNKYYDFYTYSDETKSGYSTISGTKQYYECNFDSQMPELNYDNQEVREEVLNVAKYWLEKGVDGFRFDAARYLYYGKTAQNVEFWTWYVNELKKIKSDVYTIGEVLNAGYLEQSEYFPALNVFTFEFCGSSGLIYYGAGTADITAYTNGLVSNLKGYKAKNPDAMMSALISNHDMDRMAGTLAPQNGKAQMAANLLLLTQGSPFIYYGEEIGMKGTAKDPDRRMPMQWGDKYTPDLCPGSTNVAQPNGTVKAQAKKSSSLLNYYKKVIKVRHNHPEIARGDYELLTIKGAQRSYGGFEITYNESKIALIHNAGTTEVKINLSDITGDYTKILDYVGMKKAKISGGVLTIGAQTSVILG